MNKVTALFFLCSLLLFGRRGTRFPVTSFPWIRHCVVVYKIRSRWWSPDSEVWDITCLIHEMIRKSLTTTPNRSASLTSPSRAHNSSSVNDIDTKILPAQSWKESKLIIGLTLAFIFKYQTLFIDALFNQVKPPCKKKNI